VFFDDPVPPWRPHGDRCIPYLIRYLRDVEGQPFAQIRRRVEQHASILGTSVPRDIDLQLRVQENRERGSATVCSILPEGSDYNFEGVVFGTQLQVNFLKRLGYADNAISRGLLGAFGKRPFVELILRSDMNPSTRIIAEYACYLPAYEFEKASLHIGAKVGLVLKVAKLPNGNAIWTAESAFKLTPSSGEAR
jgi:hypothetical protein